MLPSVALALTFEPESAMEMARRAMATRTSSLAMAFALPKSRDPQRKKKSKEMRWELAVAIDGDVLLFIAWMGQTGVHMNGYKRKRRKGSSHSSTFTESGKSPGPDGINQQN